MEPSVEGLLEEFKKVTERGLEFAPEVLKGKERRWMMQDLRHRRRLILAELERIRQSQPAKPSFARTAWSVEDLQELRPRWSSKQCEEFLRRNEEAIREAMVERGWQAIDTLLSLDEGKRGRRGGRA
ncbi:MAG: hypothetical protein HY548_09310 [Elusimicrobia bacterium]|nr:hypothetical protein [Elusimicrobiota bacterium]